MSAAAIIDLAWRSLVAPRDVARWLVSLNIRGEALVLALAAVVVLNSLVFLALTHLSGAPAALGPLAVRPILFLIAMAVSVVASIVGLTAVGRLLGGTGDFAAVGILIAWLQTLRLALQVVLGVVTAISPALGSLVVMFGMAAGVWILLNFLDVAHGFESLAKSAVVLVLAIMAIVLALSLVLQGLGVGQNGMAFHV